MLDAGVKVGRKHATTATATATTIGVAVALVPVAAEVGVDSPVDLEADLVLVAGTAPGLDADPVLGLLVAHAGHFFRGP